MCLNFKIKIIHEKNFSVNIKSRNKYIPDLKVMVKDTTTMMYDSV